MVAVIETRTPRRTGVLVRTSHVVLAIGQIVSSALVSAYGGAFTAADRPGEPLIVPPGPMFSIWSVIITFSVGYAIWAWFARQPDLELRNALARPLLVVVACFSGWLAAAELEPVWSTLVVFVGLLAGLLWALKIALQHRATIRRWSRLGRGLLWGTLGLYTGWGSIAIWLNLTTAMADSGAPVTGPVGTAGQLAILAGATVTGVVLVHHSDGLLPYAAGAGWALGGAALGSYAAGSLVLAAAAGVGLLVLLVALTVQWRRRLGRRPSPLETVATVQH